MMFDEWNETARNAAQAAGIGGGVSLAVGIIQQRYSTAGAWTRGILAGMLVAGGSSLIVSGSSLTVPQQWFVAGAVALVAQDMLDGITALSRKFRADPHEFIATVLRAIRGVQK